MPAKRSSSAAAVEEQQSTAKPQQPAAEQQQQQQQQEKYRLTGGDIVVLRPRIFVTVEGRGQIMELARDCWTRFHTEVVDHLKGKTEGMWAAADANEAKTGDGLQSYRAGAVVACLPEDLAALPACATVSNTSGGYYLKFTMRGDYDNLGEAWGVAVERASHTPGVERDLAREGLENYLNSPMHMDGLPDFFTDIYIPIKETAPEFSISSGRVVEWTTPRRFAYIEAKGGFAKIADALFGRMHGELMPKIGWENVTCSFGLSLDHYVEADGTPAGTYRVAVQLKPNFELPAEVAGEVQVAEVAGRFLCFGMVGDYANIPTAWQHIMGAVERDSSVTMDKAVRPLIEEFTATPFAPLGTTKCVTQFFVPIAS